MALQITESNITHLEPGDLVEFKGIIYSHWGIYKGEEEVIHLTGVGDGQIVSNAEHVFTISGRLFKKAQVVKDNIWKVANRRKIYKRNDQDRSLSPLKPDDILERAMSKLGPVEYNLIISNCEHFATWCRYGDGKGKSQQVNNVIVGGSITAGVAGAVLVVLRVIHHNNR